MNEKFFALSPDKQNTILNSAMAEFAQYDYKKASTDAIILRAGISKGLLFHYFGSKKSLYLYLFQYAMQFLVTEMRKDVLPNETDFFALLENAQKSKIGIMRKHPDLFPFLTNAYIESDPAVAPTLSRENAGIMHQSREAILARADDSKFKDGVSMAQTLDMILWMSDGLMRDRIREAPYDLDAINDEYLSCLAILKQNLYKEAFL